MYKIWQIPDTDQTLGAGTDHVCDAVLHNDVEASSSPEFGTSGIRPPSYRATKNFETSSSSSHLSVSHTYYLKEFALLQNTSEPDLSQYKFLTLYCSGFLLICAFKKSECPKILEMLY